MASSNKKLFVANWLPAVLLTAVALAQIVRALTTEQVIGKGGGFGMFAVVDTRANRTWSADCLTPDREPCRIYLQRKEGPLERLSPAVDSYPRESVHQLVADRLIRAKYVRLQPSELAESLELSRNLLDLVPPETLRTPLYRLARRNEDGVSLPAIRLRYWRVRFADEPPAMRVESLSGAQERGVW